MNIASILVEGGSLLAIDAHDNKLSYSELSAEILRIAQCLQSAGIQRLGLYADNSAAWICMDLACMQANIVIVPIPLFFSTQQVEHLLDTAELDALFCDRELPLDNAVFRLSAPSLEFVDGLKGIDLHHVDSNSAQALLSGHAQKQHAIPVNTAKITFTSGSTGQPKGVCLSSEHQIKVATSLVARVNITKPRHLVALPLSTLLENIAGVYAPLLSKGCVIVPSEKQRGFSGSQLSDVQAFLSCISDANAHTLITVPELLKVMVAASQQGWSVPASFVFIAVGGAKVAKSLVESARAIGLPVYQGYGLSECASVVSLAGPQDPPDSCGQPLGHVNYRLQGTALHITDHVFLGYLGEPESWYPKEVNTGDLVAFEQNCLFIKGRHKQQIINSLGRNISPEWAESLILANPLIHQACIIGEARPYCMAIISVYDTRMGQAQVASYLKNINKQLPDYAKVRKFILLNTPMSQQQGLITANGRIKRHAVNTYFSQQIDLAYKASGKDSSYPELEQLIEQEYIHDTI
jgi:long-chain acyl-CoA synthetase